MGTKRIMSRQSFSTIAAATLAGLGPRLFRRGVYKLTDRLTDRAVNSIMPYRRSRYRGGYRSRVYRPRRVFRSRRRYYRRRRTRYSRRQYPAKRARIGSPVGYGTTKRFLAMNSSLGYASRTLYSRDLTHIPRTTTNALNGRQRDMVNLRGFKIDLKWNTSAANMTSPHILHLAVVCPVSDTQNPSTPIDNGILPQNWFRGNSAARAIDFGTSLSSIQMHSLAINADNYVILKRKSYKLGNADNTTGLSNDRVGGCSWWVKINRQVRYDDVDFGDLVVNGRCFLVWWLDQYQGGSGTPVSDMLFMDAHIITYFREPYN